MPRSSPPTEPSYLLHAKTLSRQGAASMSPIEPLPTTNLPYPVEPPEAHIPDKNLPQLPRKGLPTNPRPGQLGPSAGVIEDVRSEQPRNRDTKEIRQSNTYLGNLIQDREPSPPPPPAVVRKPAPLNALPKNPRPVRKESMASQVTAGSDYGDGFMVTPPSPGREEMRGQRYSMDVPPEEFAQAGLGAPSY